MDYNMVMLLAKLHRAELVREVRQARRVARMRRTAKGR
jgi:hypothetical protein